MSKRILLLGGSKFILPAIHAAHDMGYETITCDYLPNNLAHKYSDYYENANVVDKDAVLNVAQKMQVEGILSFACDPGAVSAAYVAEEMGLPTVGPYDSVCILQDKKRFRKFLVDNGFKSPVSKAYSSYKDLKNELDSFRYPLIIKPSDSAGSKGVKRVINSKELKSAINDALLFSRSGEFIVEEFLEPLGHPSDSECFSVNGKMEFVSYSAQYFDPLCKNPYGPVGFTWNSTISDSHKRELTDEMQRLLRLLGMDSSIYNVETRECVDGQAYIMELSPRAGGNRLAEMIRWATGVDLVKASVCAALGKKIEINATHVDDGLWAEIILHTRRSGCFERLIIDDDLKKHLVEEDLWVSSGEYIYEFTGANRTIGTLVFHFDDAEKMKMVMDSPDKYIKVVVK